ncbi:unnamed protein product [Prunus armeniaca]|uniref:Ribosomal eL28/Mak16 domain-containing protein n=3 Tax=Prunus TaxID=3754 RepID=A0A6J5VLV9_PRUAR|nr:unnamed protein product [Prunus armeniaca]
MATVPGQLIWEVVKKNNSFLVKQFGRGNAGVRFSKEPNNLYNLHSYKHSGLANKKTVTIQPGGKDQSVVLATTKTKKQNKPASLLHKSVIRKEFPRVAKAVINQVADNFYRPDLKKAALARLSVVHRSLKVSKSGVKKRNRQAVKTPGRKRMWKLFPFTEKGKVPIFGMQFLWLKNDDLNPNSSLPGAIQKSCKGYDLNLPERILQEIKLTPKIKHEDRTEKLMSETAAIGGVESLPSECSHQNRI